MSNQSTFLYGNQQITPVALVGGVWKPAGAPVNLSQQTAAINPSNGTKVENISNRKETWGSPLATIYTPAPHTFSFTVNESNKDLFAMAFLGSAAATGHAASSTPVDAEVFFRSVGEEIHLGKYQIAKTTVNVKLTATPATSYTEGKDYVIDYAAGTIKLLPGTAIPLTTTGLDNGIAVQFEHGAAAGFLVKAGLTGHIDVKMEFFGINRATGGSVTWRVPKASIRPTGGLNLSGNAFMVFNFEGQADLVAGEDAAYYYEESGAA